METVLAILVVQAVIIVILVRSRHSMLLGNLALRQPFDWLRTGNDGIFGQFGKRVTAQVNGKKVSCRSTLDLWLAKTRGIRGIATPYHAPKANSHVERFNGTLRSEVLEPTSLLPTVGATKAKPDSRLERSPVAHRPQ